MLVPCPHLPPLGHTCIILMSEQTRLSTPSEELTTDQYFILCPKTLTKKVFLSPRNRWENQNSERINTGQDNTVFKFQKPPSSYLFHPVVERDEFQSASEMQKGCLEEVAISRVCLRSVHLFFSSTKLSIPLRVCILDSITQRFATFLPALAFAQVGIGTFPPLNTSKTFSFMEISTHLLPPRHIFVSPLPQHLK